MRIVGMNQGGHNSSICVLNDGVIEFAVPEERLNREKLTGKFPRRSIDYWRSKFGGPVDAWVMSWQPMYNAESRPGGQMARRWRPEYLYQVPTQIEAALGLSGSTMVKQEVWYENDRLLTYFVGHHISHAFSAIGVSGFNECAVYTCDAFGEKDSMTMGLWSGGKLTYVVRQEYPISLGQLYASFTEYLGYVPTVDEWKVMALGACSKDKGLRSGFLDLMRQIVSFDPERGQIAMDLKYFQYGVDRKGLFSSRMAEAFGPPRKREDGIDERHMAVAYALQKRFEEVTLDALRWLQKKTGMKRLVCSGGAMMNSVTNGRIENETGFVETWIGGWPEDGGTAIGAAFYADSLLNGRTWWPRVETTSFGPEYEEGQIRKVLKQYGLKYEEFDLDEIPMIVAGMLDEGMVVAWFNGKCEFGHRALGNRSILADPRSAEMKDRVNSKIKYREWYRPFAPSVLEERAEEFFDFGNIQNVPFMEKVVPCRETMQSKIPAVVHFDGTSRIQTVREVETPMYYRIIKAFEAMSGIPMVMNTSFNVAGEPIVCSPDDAIRTYTLSGLDALIMPPFVLRKR